MRLVMITSDNSLYPVIVCVVFVGSIHITVFFDICVPLFITGRESPTAREVGTHVLISVVNPSRLWYIPTFSRVHCQTL